MEALTEGGIDVELTIFEGGHFVPIEQTAANRQEVRIVRLRKEPPGRRRVALNAIDLGGGLRLRLWLGLCRNRFVGNPWWRCGFSTLRLVLGDPALPLR